MTSRHASEGGPRGVAGWIIVTIVTVIVAVGATTAYLLIVGSDDAPRAACTAQVVLPVVASPGSAGAISAAATAFDATGPVARSACVSTTVTSMPGAQAGQQLATDWAQDPAPTMWVPDSAADLLALEAVESGLTAGRAIAPMATSPVVIAVRSEDAATVTAASLSWPDLAAATGPDGTVTLASGRHLVLALPNPTANRATSYALQSVLAARGGTVDAGTVTAATAELATIGDGGPATQPVTTEEALTQLAAGTGGFTAVPVVESELTAFTARTPGLTAVSPAGRTVGDTIYAVPLTARWVTPTLEDASAVFMAYLRGPDGVAVLSESGLRVAGSTVISSSTSASTDEASTAPGGSQEINVIPDAGQQVAAALAAAIGAGPTG